MYTYTHIYIYIIYIYIYIYIYIHTHIHTWDGASNTARAVSETNVKQRSASLPAGALPPKHCASEAFDARTRRHASSASPSLFTAVLSTNWGLRHSIFALVSSFSRVSCSHTGVGALSEIRAGQWTGARDEVRTRDREKRNNSRGEAAMQPVGKDGDT